MPKITSVGSKDAIGDLVLYFKNPVEKRNSQDLEGWMEWESCCTASLLVSFNRGNSTFSHKCRFEPLAVRDLLGLLAAGGLWK